MRHNNLKKVTDENGRIRVQTVNNEKTMTQQHFKDDVDINRIMKKLTKTGQLDHTSRTPGFYADVSELGDYHDSLNKVVAANAAFMSLPADVRARFKNDPGSLVEFLKNPDNKEEAKKLGLLKPSKDAGVNNNDLNDKKTPPSKSDSQNIDPSLLQKIQDLIRRSPPDGGQNSTPA